MDPEELHVASDAFEMSCARRRPVQTRGGADSVTRGLGNQHSPGTRRAGYAARDVDGTAEPVTRTADRAPGGDANPQAGQVVCDIGAGPGYFALRISREVGTRGAVFAVDVEPRMLEVLRKRIQKSGVSNVVPVLGLSSDPLIPGNSCDLILVVDTFHHFPDGVAYLRRLVRSLRKGGRLVNIDFHKRELPVGPPVEHKVSREEFLTFAESAGLVLKAEHQFLPYQYFLVFQAS